MKHKPTVVLFFLVSFSLSLILFNLTEKVIVLRDFFGYLIFPAPSLALRIVDKGRQFSENIVSFVLLHQQNQEYKNKIRDLELIRLQYEVLLRENEHLREILKLSGSIRYNMIVARVISRDPTNWFRSIVIDKGRNSDIRDNMPVIVSVENNINLIGRTIETEDSFAKVLLLTDALSNVPVKVERSKETGVVTGQGDMRLLLNYLLPYSDVKIGDKIITSGIGEIFPEGIPLGSVESIYTRKNTYYKQALIRPFVNWNKITMVCILSPKTNK